MVENVHGSIGLVSTRGAQRKPCFTGVGGVEDEQGASKKGSKESPVCV